MSALDDITASLAKFRTAKRVSGANASYKKDNPAEYGKVIVYLDGGARPSGVTTDMGMALLLEEDARRALGASPPPPTGSYYVANGGNDGNSGTLSAPLATVQAGLNKLFPGDTLVLRGGTYSPLVTLTLPRDGTAASPINIQAYPGETAVIDGAGVRTTVLHVNRSWVNVRALTVQNTAYTSPATEDGLLITGTDIVLEQLTVKNASEGIDIAASAYRVTVRGCDVSGGKTGVNILGHSVLVENCTIHDNNKMANNGADTGGEHGGQAISVNETSGPVEVRNNDAWNNNAASISYGRDGVFVELYRSQNVNVHHNRSRNNVVTFEAAGDTSGIKLWRNEVRDEHFFVAHQANNMLIANNSVWRPSTVNDGTLIWIGPGNFWGTGSTAGLMFRNNILCSGVGIMQLAREWDASATVDNNSYYSITGGWFGSFGATNLDTYAQYLAATAKENASVFGNPLMVDPGNGNLQLQAGSPLINKGASVAGVTEGYLGAAPDIGAVELA